MRENKTLRVKKVLSLTAISLMFMARVAAGADACPDYAATPPEKGGVLTASLPSGVAVSDGGQLVANGSGIDKGQALTYADLELFAGCSGTYGGVQPGDSGSPAATDDGALSRVGMVVGGDSTGIDAYVEPITTMRSDFIEKFGLTGDIVKIADTSTLDDQYPELTQMQHSAELAISSNSWIAKLKHVTQVTPCWFFDKSLPDGGETGVCVGVDSPDHVKEVTNKVPSKLSGVRVRIEPPHVGIQ